MAKKILKKLSLCKIFNRVSERLNVIKQAPENDIPALDSYIQNQLKNALHPDVQHVIISEIIEHSNDVKTFVFTPDKEAGTEKLAYFSAGQYICIRLQIGDAKISRPYSLSSSPKESLEGKYTLTIKRVDGGLCSQYVLDNWTVGTKVNISGPLGVFTYEPLRDAKTVIGVAGGSGITPFYSLAKAIADGDEDCNLTLLYGSRTKADILFHEEFKAIEAKCDKFKLVNVLSNEDAEDCEKGFITADLIKKYAPEGDYSIFLCGPQAMYNFADKEIAKLGIRQKFVRHELFGEYHNPEKNDDYPQEAVGRKFKLTVIICGEKQEIECDANETLLVAMEKHGIAAPSECRSGICGYCHSRLVSGNVYVPKSVDGRRLADLEYGYVHPCCTFPIGDVVIDVPPMKE